MNQPLLLLLFQFQLDSFDVIQSSAVSQQVSQIASLENVGVMFAYYEYNHTAVTWLEGLLRSRTLKE